MTGVKELVRKNRWLLSVRNKCFLKKQLLFKALIKRAYSNPLLLLRSVCGFLININIKDLDLL